MIENEWFPKAVGLWRVQGGALALLLGSVANDGGEVSGVTQIRTVPRRWQRRLPR